MTTEPTLQNKNWGRALTLKERAAAEREGVTLFHLLEQCARANHPGNLQRQKAAREIMLTAIVQGFTEKYL